MVNVLKNQQSVRQIEIKVTSVDELAKRQNIDISKLQERLDEVLDMLIEVKVAQARHKQE